MGFEDCNISGEQQHPESLVISSLSVARKITTKSCRIFQDDVCVYSLKQFSVCNVKFKEVVRHG